MPRIKDYSLATATASDEFLVIDGATNGTRKLSAYSPTFGGNLIANGNITSKGILAVDTAGNSYAELLTSSVQKSIWQLSGNNVFFDCVSGSLNFRTLSSNSITLRTNSTTALTIDSSQNAALAGNLTVSGTGTSTFSGNLRLQNTAYFANTATVDATTKLTIDTIAQQGIDIFRSDANANYSAIRFRNSANSATNAQIGWNGTSLRLEGTPVEVAGNLTVSGNIVSSQDVQLGNTYTLTWGGAYGAGIPSIAGSTGAGNIQIYPTGSTSGATATFTASTTTLAGNLGIGTTSPNKSTFSTAVTVNGGTNSGFEVAVGDTRIAGFYAASTVAVLNVFANVPLDFSTNNTTRARLTETGNLLLGTTTDSGSGKLQLASSTANSGGLGFGSDVSLYRSGAGTLSLMDYTSAATGVGGVLNLQGFTSGTSGLNNFAIIKGTKSSGTVGGIFTVQTSDTSGNPQTALTLDSSQNATFAGSIAIGNTVNTVSPTSPNRTITMVIGGTTYYIHAKTTND